MILNGKQTNPGDLRTSVTLQTPTLTKDAGGAQVEGWASFASTPDVWAKIIYAHGRESVSTDALKTTNRMTLTIRYRSDVNASHAVLINGERWKFIGTPDDIQNRHEYLEIQAELIKGSI